MTARPSRSLLSGLLPPALTQQPAPASSVSSEVAPVDPAGAALTAALDRFARRLLTASDGKIPGHLGMAMSAALPMLARELERADPDQLRAALRDFADQLHELAGAGLEQDGAPPAAVGQ